MLRPDDVAACAWLAVTIYERLRLWWQEGKEDLKIEVLEHDDPELHNIKSWRGKP